MGGTWTTFTATDGLVDSHVLAITEAADGALWIGNAGGMSRLDPATKVWSAYNGLGAGAVVAIAVSPAGDVWAGTTIGDVAHAGGMGKDREWEIKSAGGGFASNEVRAVAVAPDGSAWIATDGGVSHLHGNSLTTYISPDWALTNISAITVSPNGTVWVATGVGTGGAGRGIYRFDGRTWIVVTSRDGLASDDVLDLAVGLDGTLWTATLGGVSHFDGSDWTTYTTEDGLASDNVQAVSVWPNGTVWAGTWSGLSYFDGQAWNTPSTLPGASKKAVRVLFAAPDGTIWASLGSEGVLQLTADGKLIGEQGGLVEDIAATSGGVLWFATAKGVYLHSGDTKTHYATGDKGKLNDWIQSVAVGPDDTVWFATRAGVLRCRIATTGEPDASPQPLDLREFEVIVVETPAVPAGWTNVCGGGVEGRDTPKSSLWRSDGEQLRYAFTLLKLKACPLGHTRYCRL